MRRKTSFFAMISLVGVLLAGGCASTKLTDWTGHNISEVIKAFGTPNRVVPAGDGGKLYVFEYQRSRQHPAWGAYGNVASNEHSCTATRSFMVRPDGTVASWNIQDCTP
jgi:hypothetical protein